MIIRLERNKFNFKFKQYEGLYFHAEINKDSEIIKYKITEDEQGIILKEFGNTHIKDNLLYIPQVEAYIDLNT
ncbi:MAG: hypothetical protein KIC98_09125 [Clostridioides difficile]|nr:hypothetical protein [Clostridioides difficile]